MSRDKTAIFDTLDQDDAALAAEVSALCGIALPRECEPGVAFNARLLQVHAQTMRAQEQR